MNSLHFCVAYYDEYMPRSRVEEDIALMTRAGVTAVRIGESTWSTTEPRDGVFDFTSLDRVVDAMGRAGIGVILGTPTYAVPPWLARKYPEILAVTPAGRNRYGPRQNMDLSHPGYRFHGERVIRRLLERYSGHPALIGYQADNETKHYHNFGPALQAAFVADLKRRFGTTEALNHAFGLDYWSNRVNVWEDFPPLEATINASLLAAYAAFQRALVTEFLAWQVGLINEYKKPGQFVTHNFDFEWRGHSFGVQPDVDHWQASVPFDVVGIDVYHPTQDQLTGAEIAFGGDLARSLRQDNYLVLETEAQGFPEWTPYPGQLRLQAFSHFASGANLVGYWHWHSIHNSFETYWKGLLSHDLQPNAVYEEAAVWGAEIALLSPHLVNLKKANRAALAVSNQALSALAAYKKVGASNPSSDIFGGLAYNDVVRRLYDAAYRLGIELDVVEAVDRDWGAYDLVLVPGLYAAADAVLQSLNRFVEQGGTLLATLFSGFADQNVKVRSETQPGVLNRALGARYRHFSRAAALPLAGDPFGVGPGANRVDGWFEFVESEGAEVLARYEHPAWGAYAALTLNRFGRGWAAYLGCHPSPELMEGVLRTVLTRSGHWEALAHPLWPVVRRSGTNARGRRLTYYLNYSAQPRSVTYAGRAGTELLGSAPVEAGAVLNLEAWGVNIVEEA